MAVRKFARDLRSHEEEHAGEPFGSAFDDSQWLATAAFILSYSAVDAWVSETVDDFQFTDEQWAPYSGKALLDRCDGILALRGQPKLDRGSEPVQPFELLKKIRDGLVHPKAEWSSAGTGSRLSDVVHRAKFPLSPFKTDPKDAFPYGCMAAGGAQWAHDTAFALISHLHERVAVVALD